MDLFKALPKHTHSTLPPPFQKAASSLQKVGSVQHTLARTDLTHRYWELGI